MERTAEYSPVVRLAHTSAGSPANTITSSPHEAGCGGRRDPQARKIAILLRRTKPIYADLSKTNPHFNKLYTSLSAFRNESLAWNQVAELSYDSFMMRMRTRT
jgi:hypothetical protein